MSLLLLIGGVTEAVSVAHDTIDLAVQWTSPTFLAAPWPVTGTGSVALTFGADSSAGAVLTYRTRLDGGSWSSPHAYGSGARAHAPYTFGTAGAHVLEIELTDSDGNSFTLIGPGTGITYTPEGPPAAHLAPSLRVGSDTLGWQEFGDVAAIGAMTRAMPGGDGSLDFSVPGNAAGERRNVLQPGAQVVLDSGDDVWAGLVLGDPLAGYYSARDAVHVAAGGPWSVAARRRDVAWVWVDSDPTQWKRIRQMYDAGEEDGLVDLVDQGKFTTDTEGRLYIIGDEDRTFKAGSRATLAYWLLGGLVDDGCRIVGVDLEYKSYVPADWAIRGRAYEGNPWRCMKSGTLEINDGTSRSSWRTLNTDLAEPATSLILNLFFGSGSSGSPAGDVYLKVRKVHVRCRYSSGTTVDRSVTIDNAMCDLATFDGLATVTRSETLGGARDQIALRPDAERSVVDGLRELAAMHADEIEYYYDRVRDPDAWRFTVNALPDEVNPQRNRHWIIDSERPGEDPSGVDRDVEAAPAFVRFTYLSNDVTGLPDGTPRSVCYPSEPARFDDAVHLYTEFAGAKLSDAEATAIAARVWTQRNAASFAGSALWPATAFTIDKVELPSRLIRPGDRLTIIGRANAANLYIADTSYDWGASTMTGNVGWPFDLIPKPYVPPRRRPRPKPLMHHRRPHHTPHNKPPRPGHMGDYFLR